MQITFLSQAKSPRAKAQIKSCRFREKEIPQNREAQHKRELNVAPISLESFRGSFHRSIFFSFEYFDDVMVSKNATIS